MPLIRFRQVAQWPRTGTSQDLSPPSRAKPHKTCPSLMRHKHFWAETQEVLYIQWHHLGTGIIPAHHTIFSRKSYEKLPLWMHLRLPGTWDTTADIYFFWAMNVSLCSVVAQWTPVQTSPFTLCFWWSRNEHSCCQRLFPFLYVADARTENWCTTEATVSV